MSEKLNENLFEQVLSVVKDVKKDIQLMKKDIQDLKTDVQGIKNEQQVIKLQLNENTEMIRAIYDRQEETDAKQEALTMDVHKLHGEVASIKEEQTLHSEILKQLADGQVRQERILERLSLRSIEQEAKLIDSRRIV